MPKFLTDRQRHDRNNRIAVTVGVGSLFAAMILALLAFTDFPTLLAVVLLVIVGVLTLTGVVGFISYFKNIRTPVPVYCEWPVTVDTDMIHNDVRFECFNCGFDGHFSYDLLTSATIDAMLDLHKSTPHSEWMKA